MTKETQGFDEAYLNECIAKASKTWEGVDVEDYMNKVRGRDDAPTSPDFDTEVYNWLKEHGSDETRQLIEMTARHFREVGRRDERMEMMKDAIECEVYDLSSNEPHPHIYVNTPGLITGDKVKVIILKAEDEQ